MANKLMHSECAPAVSFLLLNDLSLLIIFLLSDALHGVHQRSLSEKIKRMNCIAIFSGNSYDKCTIVQ